MELNKDKKIVSGALIGLFFLNIFAWLAVFNLSQPEFVEVTFFDVGQGDAIFIETPRRNQILIDGGPDSAILEKLNKKLPFWDRTIDLVILTHPENDHLAGLLDVLRSYKVKNILWTGVIRDTATFREWQELIEKEKAKVLIAKAGQKINLSTYEIDRYVEVLYPFEDLAGQEFKDSNNTSIVAKLVFGENSFLFTGDAYKSAERELISLDKRRLDSDILKISHHGSKTSTAEEFVEAVLPEIAVISAGRDNSYGHPHEETLDTLAKYDITVIRTDLDDDIKIISDGINYAVSNFQN